MSRELDARVARALGLDVVGEGRCQKYEHGEWGVSTGWPKEVTPAWPIRPIYVAHCVCDLEDFDGMPMFGHFWGCLDVVSEYSTDIAAAWQVVEWMCERGYWCEMRTPFGTGDHNDGYWCGFTPHLTSGWNGVPDDWTSAPTLPEAICLSFLAAMEAHNE